MQYNEPNDCYNGASKPAYYQQSSVSSNTSTGSQVNFQPCQRQLSEDGDDRKKYLTAKYGAHQMKLIRKRIEVEDWVDKQLKNLYNIDDTDAHTYSAEIDLDELLDMEDDTEKRNYILKTVSDAKKTPEVVNKFVNEVLLKIQTL